jgi:hypothetical protein
MRALLMHDELPDDAVAGALTAAGFDLVRCYDPGRATFPCRGAKGSCPLDGRVDVAVVVHHRDSDDLAPSELGAVCALRDAIPLVVAGNHTQSAYGSSCDAVADDVDSVVAACWRAIAAADHRASDYVGTFAGARAEVTRRGHTVTVRLPADATEGQSVLAHQAASRLYPSARIISVIRREPGAGS